MRRERKVSKEKWSWFVLACGVARSQAFEMHLPSALTWNQFRGTQHRLLIYYHMIDRSFFSHKLHAKQYYAPNTQNPTLQNLPYWQWTHTRSDHIQISTAVNCHGNTLLLHPIHTLILRLL
jgi:hypothetical protein